MSVCVCVCAHVLVTERKKPGKSQRCGKRMDGGKAEKRGENDGRQ